MFNTSKRNSWLTRSFELLKIWLMFMFELDVPSVRLFDMLERWSPARFDGFPVGESSLIWLNRSGLQTIAEAVCECFLLELSGSFNVVRLLTSNEWTALKTDDAAEVVGWSGVIGLSVVTCVVYLGMSFSLRNIRWKLVRLFLSIGTLVIDDWNERKCN